MICNMDASQAFETLANTPLRNAMLHDFTAVSVKMSRLPIGTWKNPAFPIPDSHRAILQPILEDQDRAKAYHDLAEAYMASDPSFRMTVSKYWNFGKKWGFDKSLPTLKRVQASLIFYSIAVKQSVDFRDDLMGIATEYHRCIANGLNAEEIFRSIADVSLPFVAGILIDFIERSPEDKSLKAFCLEVVPMPGGTFEIESDW